MTITNTTTKVGYTGDGITVAFPVPFPFFDTDELEVVERVISTGAETVKVLTTHYTVSGGNGSTGTVTALAAPTALVQWFILRKTFLVQETDYPQNDPFPAESHERALDRGIAISQELREILDRALKIPKTDPSTAGTELPVGVISPGHHTAVRAEHCRVGTTSTDADNGLPHQCTGHRHQCGRGPLRGVSHAETSIAIEAPGRQGAI